MAKTTRAPSGEADGYDSLPGPRVRDHAWSRRSDPEHRFTDRELGHDLVALSHAVHHPRAERVAIEGDRAVDVEVDGGAQAAFLQGVADTAVNTFRFFSRLASRKPHEAQVGTPAKVLTSPEAP